MPLPTDTTLTKLRILADREKRKLDSLEADTLRQRRNYENKRLDYVKRCNELGYCASCEKVMKECECVLLASNM